MEVGCGNQGMIYLSGSTNDVIEPTFIDAGIGLMCQPGNGYHHRIPRYPYWAADNGCFADKWEWSSWMDWLAYLPTKGCLFAVAPDVYPDARASLERGLQYTDLIRSMGFPVAVVAQDGAESLSYPWEEFDCMFIGGAKTPNPRDEWKTSEAAASVCKAARNAGKWVHMGRVNSYKRLERARAMGCLSVDGTYIKHGPNINLRRMGRFLRVLEATPTLPIFDRFESVAYDALTEPEEP
jgi:hypothetical protein